MATSFYVAEFIKFSMQIQCRVDLFVSVSSFTFTVYYFKGY